MHALSPSLTFLLFSLKLQSVECCSCFAHNSELSNHEIADIKVVIDSKALLHVLGTKVVSLQVPN